MPLPGVKALAAVNEDVIACERRLHDQSALIVAKAAEGRVTDKDEVFLASYMASLTLTRAHRDCFLADAPANA